MKLSNTILLVILLALGIVMFFMQRSNSKDEKRTFRKELIEVDTTQISSVIIYPVSTPGQEIKFEKQGTGAGWQISAPDTSGVISNADFNQVFTNLLMIKPQRLVSRNADKHAAYKLDEAQATKIKVLEGDKTTLDLRVGKFDFQQRKADPNMPPQMQQQMQQNPIMTSYVRLGSEDDIYAVDGILSMIFDRKAKDFFPKPKAPPTAPPPGGVLPNTPGNKTLPVGKLPAGNK